MNIANFVSRCFLMLLFLACVFCERSAAAQEEKSKDWNLDWLGALPKKMSNEDLFRRYGKTMGIKLDVSSVTNDDVLRFTCKTPEQVGPVPMLDAVDAYIDGLPESRTDSAVMSKLNESAKNGNWLARLQLLSWMSDTRPDGLEMQYREAQLTEWLQKNKIGGLYALVGYAVVASGYYSDSPGVGITAFDIFAALHNAYPSQYKVGKALMNSRDHQMVAIGEKMVACAENSLASYKRAFSGEAEKNQQTRKKHETEKTYTDLHRAVLNDDAAAVENILRDKAVDVNAKTIRDQTPLDFALQSKKINREIVRLLIQRGAEVAHHGAVDKMAGEYDEEDLLTLAVKAEKVDMDVVRMLVSAGANPFDSMNSYTVLQSAFYHSFDLYESGAPDVFEFFLSTKLLDKDSERAVDFLGKSISSIKVFNRLEKYGISPDRSDGIIKKIVESAMQRGDGEAMERIRLISALEQRYPRIRAGLKGEQGYRALDSVVRACDFRIANQLLDFGVPVQNPDGESNGQILSSVVGHCDVDRSQMDIEEKMARALLRNEFLRKLSALKYDFNAMARNCPAWTNDLSCDFPLDDKLAELLLDLGADPFLFHPKQKDAPLASLIESCRVNLLGRVLAKGPKMLDQQTRKGLSLALDKTRHEPWEGLNCPANFTRETAEKLKLLGAQPMD